MNNLAKVIALGGRRLNKALAMHYLFSEQGTKGYIPLAYIKSTGTQHIDLGITPSDDMEFEIEYQSLAARATKLFGCENTSKSLFDAYNVGRGGATIRVFAHGGTHGGSPTDITTIAGQKNILKLVVNNGQYSVYVNGELVATSPAVGVVPKLNIFLFASNRNGSPDGYGSQIVYGCRVKKSGELVGDFRPYLNAEGEAGMYNTVDRKFHKNLGTGEFIAGYGIDNYVHDSANLFLDGIWNSAEGVHSDTLTSWVDLSGNCQPTPLNTGNTVGENCISSDGTLSGKMVVPDVDPVNLTTFTLEIIYKKGTSDTKNAVICGRDYTTSYYANISDHKLTVWIGKSAKTIAYNLDYTKVHVIQVTCTGTTATAWVDGVKKAENFSANAQNTSDNLTLFGRKDGHLPLEGSIMAIRIHNRILTDAELAQNFEIDQARFGLTETASVMSMADETDTEVTEDDIV